MKIKDKFLFRLVRGINVLHSFPTDLVIPLVSSRRLPNEPGLFMRAILDQVYVSMVQCIDRDKPNWSVYTDEE